MNSFVFSRFANVFVLLKVQHNEHIFCQKEVTRIDDCDCWSKKEAMKEREEDEKNQNSYWARLQEFENILAKMVDGFTWPINCWKPGWQMTIAGNSNGEIRADLDEYSAHDCNSTALVYAATSLVAHRLTRRLHDLPRPSRSKGSLWLIIAKLW